MQNNNKLRMQLHRFLFSVMLLFAAITSVGLLSSCSENEKDTDEFANGLIEAYEVFRKKSIKIAEIDKYQEDGVVTFTVDMKGRSNISDVVVLLSSIKNVEYVRDV